MKLYSTVTSERASKGQGGNKFIRVNFAIGSAKDSKEVMSIVLNDKGVFEIRDKNHNMFEEIHIENLLLVSKGNQKKDDNNLCPKYKAQILPDENGNCSLCGVKHKGML